MKKSVFGLLTIAAAAFAFTACSGKTTASIDWKFNTQAADPANYFNWSVGDTTVKDGFDAASGASKAKSTTAFNVIRYDDTGKVKAVPAGLRSLMMYPVAVFDTAVNDNFTVAAESKKLVITFVHRGTAYQVTTDENGVIDVPGSFKMAAGLADNVAGTFTVKPDYLLAGADNTKMSSIDWSKVTFVDDLADEKATYTFSGKLNSAYANGILTLKGKLTKNASAAPAQK